MVLGVVVKKAGEERGTLVVRSSPHGFVGWSVSLAAAGAGACLLWGEATADSVKLYTVEDPSEWSCVETKAVPPGDGAHGPSGSFRGVRVMPVGTRTPLLEFVARRGFQGLTCAELRRIFNELKIEYRRGAKPTSKVELLAALIRHCVPAITDVELEAAVLKHEEEDSSVAAPTCVSFSKDPDALSLVLEEAQDEDMLEAVKSTKTRFAPRSGRG
jgi:hypothetical protein